MNLKPIQITIPKTIKVLFCPKKNVLSISGVNKEKTLKSILKIFISEKKTKTLVINVTNIPIQKMSKNELKKIKGFQSKLVSDIKKIFLEVSLLLYKKLNLIGIGYRILIDKNFNDNFTLKLGYSHLIYCKLSDNVKVYSNKYNRMTVFGNFNLNMTQTLAKIRSLKYPEPYKGKGILYSNEKIKLKIGKRV